jgi:hypothetical protein
MLSVRDVIPETDPLAKAEFNTLRERLWSLTSACVRSASGAEKSRPTPQKYFFDSIDPKQT